MRAFENATHRLHWSSIDGDGIDLAVMVNNLQCELVLMWRRLEASKKVAGGSFSLSFVFEKALCTSTKTYYWTEWIYGKFHLISTNLTFFKFSAQLTDTLHFLSTLPDLALIFIWCGKSAYHNILNGAASIMTSAATLSPTTMWAFRTFTLQRDDNAAIRRHWHYY